ncbi:hypothetical protein ACQKOM_22030 [Peribacillus frigoritolerans]|uniref:hypothetical protein n=1 Tax=Peribacillus frigoritolerans TaxID=450367 RepID=UPI003D06B273
MRLQWGSQFKDAIGWLQRSFNDWFVIDAFDVSFKELFGYWFHSESFVLSLS